MAVCRPATSISFRIEENRSRNACERRDLSNPPRSATSLRVSEWPRALRTLSVPLPRRRCAVRGSAPRAACMTGVHRPRAGGEDKWRRSARRHHRDRHTVARAANGRAARIRRRPEWARTAYGLTACSSVSTTTHVRSPAPMAKKPAHDRAKDFAPISVIVTSSYLDRGASVGAGAHNSLLIASGQCQVPSSSRLLVRRKRNDD